ncbi:MAG: helix-turn-helix domain-containing protein [Bacteroidetes bacterium]|nr:helix-turn-helix domain-containing protein [Bacteroidota bacterium]MBL6943225.1 helix-turn-helix domain-containing protein [Bacteroidales bacterium]
MEESILNEETIEIIMQKLEEISKTLQINPAVKNMRNEWLDLQETCQVLRISKRTLQFYRQQNLLPGSKIHGKVYIKVKDIQRMLDDHYIDESLKLKRYGR